MTQSRGTGKLTEHGPIGFRFIEDAPRDGSFIVLRFAPNVLDRIADELGEPTDPHEVIGHWQNHAEMKTGGAFFDHEGFYLSPQPKYFAYQGRAALKQQQSED